MINKAELLAWLDEKVAACEAAMDNCRRADYWFGETHWDGCREAYEKMKAHLEALSESEESE